MDNEIENAAQKETEKEAETEVDVYSIYRKMLIFSINENQFSVDSKCVDEIVNDTEIFPLPFAPENVEGVINLRGIPVTVFNPFMDEKSAENKEKKLSHCNILKFKCADEAFGIRISTVETFMPENEADKIEELDVEKLKLSLRNALGYEDD